MVERRAANDVMNYLFSKRYVRMHWAVPVNKCTGGRMKTRGCPGVGGGGVGGGGVNMDVRGRGGGCEVK